MKKIIKGWIEIDPIDQDVWFDVCGHGRVVLAAWVYKKKDPKNPNLKRVTVTIE